MYIYIYIYINVYMYDCTYAPCVVYLPTKLGDF